MRFIKSLLSAALLMAGAMAAKKSSEERFNSFHAKALASSPVKLSDVSYKTLTEAPRDYSVSVLLTAMDPRYGCHLCREFQPEWDLLAKSWTKGDKKGESRVIFGTLDFTNGRDTFLSLGLQTAPVLLHFPPTTGPHAATSQEPVRYDFSSGPQNAEQVRSWLVRHIPEGPHPEIVRPINWVRWISGVTITMGVLTFIYVASDYILPIVTNRNVWAAISVMTILIYTSGQMFNQIRNTPYIGSDSRGGIVYFTRGFQSQVGIETQLVGCMYAIMALCSITLAVKVPRMADSSAQQRVVLICGGALFLTYSFFLSIFRIKNAGYPFSLPPFM